MGSYAVFAPERRWLCDLRRVVRELESMPMSELRQRFDALHAVRPLLTYDRPGGRYSYALGSALLWEAKLRCGTRHPNLNNDTWLYPAGVPLQRALPVVSLNGSSV